MRKNLLLLLLLLFCAVAANAQYTITGSSIMTSTVSCGANSYMVTTSGYTTGLAIKTYLGDGTSRMDTVFSASPTGYARVPYNYKSPGTYTVKHVLLFHGFGIDSVVKSYYISQCNQISIKYFQDANSNNIFDAGEPIIHAFAAIEVDSAGIIVDTIPSQGECTYVNYAPPGTVYKFRPITTSTLMSISYPTSGIIAVTIPPSSSSLPAEYFAVECSGGTGFDFSAYAVIPVTGIHDQWGNIYVANFSSCAPVSATVILYFSPKYSYKASSVYPAAAATTANSITWNLTDVTSDPIDLYYAIWDDAYVLKAGDTVHEHIEVTPITGDINPTDNLVTIIDTVKAGVDPNEISVSPSGHIASGTQLQYKINFENTGNDTAFNISVYDTLSPDVNINSLKVLMASSAMNLAVLHNGGYNVVKFDFPNINLRDSSHHGECDGAVIFTINTKQGLPDGTKIDNRAGIYFDYNDVVMTNTAENIIGFPSGVTTVNNPSQVTLYPNPANDILTINTGNNTYNTLSITNTIGQSVLTQSISTPQTKVNVKSLPSGIYYVTLRGESGIKVQKFEKL